jgi:sugar phosphate isomerase/epimerase
MLTKRRNFIRQTAGWLGAAGMLAPTLESLAAETKRPDPDVSGKSKMKIGLVTYELAKDWTIDVLIKNCQAAQFEGVELRTTHAHGVELSLSKEQRAEVKRRFQDSLVQLMGLGGIYDYHTPDQTKLRKDIEDSKAYAQLAADVGATGIKVRPNGLPKEVPKEKTLEQIGRSLREIGEFAAGIGVAIRLEVHGQETSLVPNIKKILDVADHKNVGACWNSNDTDLAGEGFDHNFNLIKDKIIAVHMRDLFIANYPFRKLLTNLSQMDYRGFCLAEIPPSADPIRVMKYYRALWLAYQG